MKKKNINDSIKNKLINFRIYNRNDIRYPKEIRLPHINYYNKGDTILYGLFDRYDCNINDMSNYIDSIIDYIYIQNRSDKTICVLKRNIHYPFPKDKQDKQDKQKTILCSATYDSFFLNILKIVTNLKPQVNIYMIKNSTKIYRQKISEIYANLDDIFKNPIDFDDKKCIVFFFFIYNKYYISMKLNDYYNAKKPILNDWWPNCKIFETSDEFLNTNWKAIFIPTIFDITVDGKIISFPLYIENNSQDNVDYIKIYFIGDKKPIEYCMLMIIVLNNKLLEDEIKEVTDEKMKDILYNNIAIFSSQIYGRDCFESYKGDRGVKGIMHLRYDLLRYFTFIKKRDAIITGVWDSATAIIKNSKNNKNLLLERALSPNIPLNQVSIYDKYATPMDESTEEYKIFRDAVSSLREITYKDIKKYINEQCIDIDKYNNDDKIINVLFKSENHEIPNDNESRVVDIFYAKYRAWADHHDDTNLMNIYLLTEYHHRANYNKKYYLCITYNSLYRFFGEPIHNTHIDLDTLKLYNQFGEIVTTF